MKSVCLAIPPVDENYPWRAAKAGLERLGFTVHMGIDLLADALVTWSPWHGSRRQALESSYRAAGKPVIVMENGWGSPIAGVPYFQAALDGWNGTGRFPAGGPERRASWPAPLLPWQNNPAGYVLVIGQRGHPCDNRTSPVGWHQTLHFDGPIIRRPRDATRPLAADLSGAREVHVWTSNAASHAIWAGIPVVQHGPNLMVSALASRPGQPLFRGERTAELDRLAWAQWTSAEISTGEPFARLLAA